MVAVFMILGGCWVVETVLVFVNETQCSPLSYVEECRDLALIGREFHSDATPALLCHKEPARASKAPYYVVLGALERTDLTGLCLLLAGSGSL